MATWRTQQEIDTSHDLALVHAAKQGDMAAFEQLVERYTAMIFRVAMHIMNSHEDAEDIVQDAFLKASLCLQCSCKSQSTMLRYQGFLSGQSEWEQSLRQFWFPADSLPWRTGGRCALFFTLARFWSRRQLLRWELG